MSEHVAINTKGTAMSEQIRTYPVKAEEHLGDGLFVSFDGWTFCLRAPRQGGDHVVYFDSFMLKHLNEFARRELQQPATTDASTKGDGNG